MLTGRHCAKDARKDDASDDGADRPGDHEARAHPCHCAARHSDEYVSHGGVIGESQRRVLRLGCLRLGRPVLA